MNDKDQIRGIDTSISFQIHYKDLKFPTNLFLSAPRNRDTGLIPTSGVSELLHPIPLIPKQESGATDSHIVLQEKQTS